MLTAAWLALAAWLPVPLAPARATEPARGPTAPTPPSVRSLSRPLCSARRVCAPPVAKLLAPTIEFDTLAQADQSPVGVLLLSVGAPETPSDVEEYLYNVFTDPEIRTLPPFLSWAFKKPLAWAISRERAEAARESMMQAGGRSPQLSTVQAQAKALQLELAERGVDSRTFIAMRYWKCAPLSPSTTARASRRRCGTLIGFDRCMFSARRPYAEDAVEAIKKEGIQKLVILPLYPQFSLSTSGSALRVLERMLYTDPGFPMKSSVVPAWYNRPGYLEAMAKNIHESLLTVDEEERAKAVCHPPGLVAASWAALLTARCSAARLRVHSTLSTPRKGCPSSTSRIWATRIRSRSSAASRCSRRSSPAHSASPTSTPSRTKAPLALSSCAG